MYHFCANYKNLLWHIKGCAIFTKFWRHYQLWFYRIFLQAPTEEKFYPNFKIIDLQKCIYACIYNIFPPTKSCYQELRHIIEWNGLWQKKIIDLLWSIISNDMMEVLQSNSCKSNTCTHAITWCTIFNNFYKNLDSTLNSSLWSPLFMSCLPVYLDIY